MYTGECHGITLVALSQGRHKEVALVAFGLLRTTLLIREKLRLLIPVRL